MLRDEHGVRVFARVARVGHECASRHTAHVMVCRRHPCWSSSVDEGEISCAQSEIQAFGVGMVQCKRARSSRALLLLAGGMHTHARPRIDSMQNLYFKFLKFLVVVFFVMSLLATPAFVLYILSDQLGSDSVTGIAKLALTTIGNMGEGYDLCSMTPEGATMQLSCPTGLTIGAVSASYGDPTGSCTCDVRDAAVALLLLFEI